MANSIKVNDFIVNQQVRDEYIERVDVLHKVKELITLPHTECLTTNQIAEFYEVSINAIQMCYSRHKAEINSDGLQVVTPKTYKAILKGTGCPIKDDNNILKPTACGSKNQDGSILNAEKFSVKNYEQLNGKMIVYIDNDTTITIPNRGITIFPLRAVLRIGMLLQESRIAEEIRTQLLNVVEETRTVNPELLTKQIDQEEQMYYKVFKDMMSGNKDAMLVSLQNLVDYQNRYKLEMEKRIDTLTTNNKVLTNEIVTISDRSSANRAVRCLANKIHKPYQAVWNSIYSHLKYKYSIDLKKRGAKPYLSHMKNSEWDTLQKTIAAIVEENGFDSKQFFEESKTLSDIT